MAATIAAVGAIVAVAAMILTGTFMAAVVAALVAASLVYVVSAPPELPRMPEAEVEKHAPADSISLKMLAEPALLIDSSGHVTAANAAARRMTGTGLVGEALAVALRHPAVLDAVRILRERDGAVEREIGGLGPQEGIYRLRAVALDEGRSLLTFSDVSAARLAERMRVDFVANASHELRTPLATILGFVETLQGPAADDPAARIRFLDIMEREAKRMTRLIDDLLSLSRIELDKYVRPTTPLDLKPLLAEVGRTLAMRLEADSRPLTIDAPEELPRVIGDRDQVLQVLHNLVSNALKYGRSGTPIRLRADLAGRKQPMVRLSVADEGEGIPAEHLPRLTERFYRVDNSRSRSLGGTGLGLAIVKHIVERHRGQLTIDSEVGRGTTVAFTLPQAEPVSQK